MALRSNTPDFLFENAYRSFPLSFSDKVDEKLSFSSLLDLKIFSRSIITGRVKLIGASRWTSGVAPTLPSSISGLASIGKIQLYFEVPSISSSLYISLDIEIENFTEEFYLSRKSINDAAGTPYISFSSIIGKTILSDFSSDGFFPIEGAYVEGAAICEAYKKSVDQLKVIHSNGSVEYVRGSIVFINGVNSSVSLSGQSTIVRARVGDGLGINKYTGSDINEKCRESILTINGVPPSKNGEFFIQGGNGISVVDVPEQNKIILSVQKGSKLISCEEIDGEGAP